MVRQNQFDNIAGAYVARYERYIENIRAAYNRTVLTMDLNYAAVSSFRKTIQDLTKQYIEKEAEYVAFTQDQLREMVEEDTHHLEESALYHSEWTAYIDDNTSFLFDALKVQAMKDNLYAANFLRAKVMQLISTRQTAYDLVFDKTEIQFYYTDKMGRKVNSVKYARVIVRDYLVKNYNDLLMGSAMLSGLEEGTTINVDSGHKDDGKSISFIEGNEVNYYDVRDEMFHPNSNTILKV